MPSEVRGFRLNLSLLVRGMGVTHLLMIETFRPGAAIAAAERQALQVSTETTGAPRLAGSWISEIGALNQLWSVYALDAASPENLPTASTDVEPSLAPVASQHLSVTAVIAPRTIAGRHVDQARRYRVRDGGLGDWVAIFLEALPAREEHSPLAALFTLSTPAGDEVLHFWPYPDLNARSAARAAAMDDPRWWNFLAKSRQQRLIAEQASCVLLPTAHSPLT